MNTHDLVHHFADVGEATIHYVTAGADAGDQPPIVLLHGWPQTWYEWRDVIPRLAAHHPVIAPDLRGLGDSSRPLEGYDKRTVAGDIFRLLAEHLGLDRWHCVGHDWGGPVTYALGARAPESMLTIRPGDRGQRALRPRGAARRGSPAHSGPRRKAWMIHDRPVGCRIALRQSCRNSPRQSALTAAGAGPCFGHDAMRRAHRAARSTTSVFRPAA